MTGVLEAAAEVANALDTDEPHYHVEEVVVNLEHHRTYYTHAPLTLEQADADLSGHLRERVNEGWHARRLPPLTPPIYALSSPVIPEARIVHVGSCSELGCTLPF